jgi:hypothetical protein
MLESITIPPYIHPDRLLKERSRYLKVAGADVGNTPVREIFFKFRATILGHSSDKFDGNDPEIDLFGKDSCLTFFI